MGTGREETPVCSEFSSSVCLISVGRGRGEKQIGKIRLWALRNAGPGDRQGPQPRARPVGLWLCPVKRPGGAISVCPPGAGAGEVPQDKGRPSPRITSHSAGLTLV